MLSRPAGTPTSTFASADPRYPYYGALAAGQLRVTRFGSAGEETQDRSAHASGQRGTAAFL